MGSMETRRARTRRRNLKHDAKMNPLSSFRLVSSLGAVRRPGRLRQQRRHDARRRQNAATGELRKDSHRLSGGQDQESAEERRGHRRSARARCLLPGRVHHVEPGLGRAGGLLHAHRRRTGKDTIRINTKQYYFWFLGSTIAGITPRIELCPGLGASFEPPPPLEPVAVTTTAPPAPPSEVDAAAQSKAATKPKATSSAKAKKKPASTAAASNPKPN